MIRRAGNSGGRCRYGSLVRFQKSRPGVDSLCATPPMRLGDLAFHYRSLLIAVPGVSPVVFNVELDTEKLRPSEYLSIQ